MTINALRMSFIFTETLLDFQKYGAPVAALTGFASKLGYIGIVDALQQGGTAPLSLSLPWPHPVGQHFWDFYLHHKAPGSAPGRLCFEKLVPLRLPKVVDKVAVVLPGVAAQTTARATLESFYFVHGIGLLLTIALEGAITHADAGAYAISLRYDKVYEPAWPGEGAAAAVTLNQLGTAALDRLRKLGFGSGISGTRSELFSIATVLRGDGVNANQALVADSPDHRLLNGLAGGVRAWSQVAAPALIAGRTQLSMRQSTAWPGNVLFAAKRGRAVWFPGQFLPTSQPSHGLACYHRNLALASLQTESLLGLAAAAEYEFAQPGVPSEIEELGQLGVGLLARLCSGAACYRSSSLQAQIAQSAQLADVNALRARLKMSPLP